jgi:hypothetical protein
MIGGRGFHFAVKINFEGQGGGIKNGPAVVAIAKVALDFAPHFGCQPAFQVFANKSDCSLAGNTHDCPR